MIFSLKPKILAHLSLALDQGNWVATGEPQRGKSACNPAQAKGKKVVSEPRLSPKCLNLTIDELINELTLNSCRFNSDPQAY
jgi:hypothetical protein